MCKIAGHSGGFRKKHMDLKPIRSSLYQTNTDTSKLVFCVTVWVECIHAERCPTVCWGGSSVCAPSTGGCGHFNQVWLKSIYYSQTLPGSLLVPYQPQCCAPTFIPVVRFHVKSCILALKTIPLCSFSISCNFLPDPFMSGRIHFSFFLLNFLGVYLLDMVLHCRYHQKLICLENRLGSFYHN